MSNAKKPSPKASLFIATYNMPRHLSLVLAGVRRQSILDFEVLICDDGSDAATSEVISAFQKESPVPIQHVWQENQGFRKCRILNEALRASHGELCIFLDGDCVPHRHFIADHLHAQKPGFYSAGRRVELGEKLSSELTPELIRAGFFDFPRPAFIRSIFEKDSEYLNRSIRIESLWIRKLLRMDRIADLKGCNYSVDRRVLEQINGFDEEYEGYGREDTDVEIRLQNAGLQIQSLKGIALQFHVWHPRRQFTPANDTRLEDLRKSKRFQCIQGLKDMRQNIANN